MNVGEWGIAALFSTGYDMSGFTALSLTFTKPDGTTLVVTNPDVTVPGTDIETTAGLFVANEYVRYVFVDGDVDQTGDWTARVTYDDGFEHLISDVDGFTVSP